MNTKKILRDVFGENSNVVKQANSKESKNLRALQCMTLVNNYIHSIMQQRIDLQSIHNNRIGRIGPNLVRFDTSTYHGSFVISPDRLGIVSQSKFSTIRANTAIYKGKWMYELLLGSTGVMQVGWSTAQSEFNQQSGVGDTIYSFAYDGNRVKKWNVATHKYGEPWMRGDIIGCALDMDDGTIEFYRNGRNLGKAFENIPMGPGIAYFPAVSLSHAEYLAANFGSTPFHYPVKGYEPLQAPPLQQINQADILFKWFMQVIDLFDGMEDAESENALLDDRTMSVRAFLMCLARSILKHVGPLLIIPYIVESTFVPFMQNLYFLKEESTKAPRQEHFNNSKLMLCLDLLWTFLEEGEMKTCLESTILYLVSVYREISLLLEFPNQYKSLIFLTNICQHSITRQHLLQYLLFDRIHCIHILAYFVHMKPLDEGGFTEVVKDVWWDTDPEDPSVDSKKKNYFDACNRIKNAVSEVEALQVELLITLLNNSDGSAETPTSRTIFLKQFKNYVQENLTSNSTPLPITLCYFHRLLVAFRILWDSEIGTNPVYVPCRVFYDASMNYSGIDRLGGVLSHLNKTYKNELLHRLGPDHEVIVAMEQAQAASNAISGTEQNTNNVRTEVIDTVTVDPVQIRMLSTYSTDPGNSMIFETSRYLPYYKEDKTPTHLGAADPFISLIELLDGIILLYHIAVKKQLENVAGLRDSMSEYIAAVANIKARLKRAEESKLANAHLIKKELLRTIDVFNTKLSEQARHMAWVRATIYSEEKQQQFAWLLRVITLTLQLASEEGNMFSFVPDFYLQTMSDLSIGIRNYVHPTAPIENIPDYEDMLLNMAEFLCNHFLDPRIACTDSKDTLLYTLAGFVSNPLTLRAVENVSCESRIKFVTNLLKPYENRAWAQSNWILVRFWQGNGFAFPHKQNLHLFKKVLPKLHQESISEPIKSRSSTIYQEHIRDILLNNSQVTVQFLNTLLNQLNSVFSEFIGLMQDIQRVSSRSQRVSIESYPLKVCAICFDLTVSLLRVLEMVSTIALSIFNNPSQSSSENLLARLCQLLCQVLNRMSSQTSCFQDIVSLEIPDLESVDYFPILAAVIGILLALLEEDISTFNLQSSKTVPKVTSTLLEEPSFQLSSLHFVLRDTQPKSIEPKNSKMFSFLNYPEEVSEKEISRVREMVNYLDVCYTLLPAAKAINDDDACTICYAYPIAAVFKPCNHQTCRICIDRHLLNSRECFFCKVIIEKVIDLSGNTLHDFSIELSAVKSDES